MTCDAHVVSTRLSEITLRITIYEGPESLRLKLEGRATGPSVGEFYRTWQSLGSALQSRKLVVDLRGVIHMDSEAVRLLAEIHEKTGAELLANTPMTKYFAEEAHRQSKEGA